MNRAIQLPNAAKTILRPGVHNIPDDVFSHWFIQGLVGSGEISVIEETSTQPVFERRKPSFVAPQAPVLPLDVEVEEIKPVEDSKVEVEEVEPVEQAPVESVKVEAAEEETPVKKIRRRKKTV